MSRTDLPLVALVFLGAACLAISQSDRGVDDVKLWALAIAAGAASVVALLRPPSPGGPRPPIGGSR